MVVPEMMAKEAPLNRFPIVANDRKKRLFDISRAL
jgi:hypothetical protein